MPVRRRPYENVREHQFPTAPVHPTNPSLADTSVFLLLRKVEIREAWSLADKLPDPFILGPTVCHGLVALMDEMKRLGFSEPGWMVIEIAEMAVHLAGLLEKIPPTTRGRPGKQKLARE